MRLKKRLAIQILIAGPLMIVGGAVSNPMIWMPLLLIGGWLLGNASGNILYGDLT